MRYLAAALVMSVSLSLASCSYFLPSTTPSAFGLLADRGDTRPFEKPLPINTQPKRLALGTDFAIAVKEDGTVWSWGYGMLGMGNFENRPTPQAIPNMTDFVEVAVGHKHVLALRKDGTVWSWGDNKKGQLGYKADGLPYGDPANLKYDQQQRTPKQIPDLKEVVSIGAGDNFSLALDKQGRVWGWGNNAHILNNVKNDEDIKRMPTVIYKNEQAVKVIATSFDSAVLTKDGHGFVWKYLSIDGSISKSDMPVSISTLLPNSKITISDIALSHSNIYILARDGFVYAQGENVSGELGDGTFNSKKEFVKVKNIGHITQISRSLALDDKGRLWQWGGGVYARPDLANMNSSREPYPINILTDKNITFILRGNYGGAIGFSNGEVGMMLKKSTLTISKPEKSLWTWK